MNKKIVAILIVIALFASSIVVYFMFVDWDIEYKTVIMKYDSREVRGYMGIPKTKQPPYPAIILIHGGAGGNWKYTQYVAQVEEVKRIIRMGYLVLSVDYGPKGTLLKGVVGRIELAGDDIADTIVAYHYLMSLDIVDKGKIFTMGGSHGGYVSLMMGTFPEINLAGVIEFYGPTNLTAGAIYLNCTITDENRTALIMWSPITWVKNYTAPILIIHGKNDKLIPIQQAYDFIDALKREGKTYEFYEYSEGHGFMFQPDSSYKSEAWEKVYEFLNEYT